MTVSRVANDDSGVRVATRARVTHAMNRLGYVPNLAARSLAVGRQCRMVLLYDNPSAAFLNELLVGCLAEVKESQSQLVVEKRRDAESVDALVRRFVAHRIDSVILPPPLCDDRDLIAALGMSGMTAVQVATGAPLEIAYAISIDDARAAKEMTSRLLAFGHKRIGFIAGNSNQTANRLRRLGYERALREFGLAVDDSLIASGDYSYRSGLAAADALLGQDVPPTAIFASNDEMAAAAVAVAHRRGIDIPRELSICGFDDTWMATTIWPTLTTIRQPVEEMARRAIQMAIATQIAVSSDRPTGSRHERLGFELVCWFSDGPPLT